jgi:hypothetical protein
MNEIDIFLTREYFTDRCTIGLFDYEDYQCFSLEDVVREKPGIPVAEWKIPGETAIPVGRYEVIRTMSNRFKKVLPILLDVEGYAGIRIHPGNTDEDTEGCILLGETADPAVNTIYKSRPAFEAFDTWLEELLAQGFSVFLNIE